VICQTKVLNIPVFFTTLREVNKQFLISSSSS
jgi:hypothetical protein